MPMLMKRRMLMFVVVLTMMMVVMLSLMIYTEEYEFMSLLAVKIKQQA